MRIATAQFLAGTERCVNTPLLEDIGWDALRFLGVVGTTGLGRVAVFERQIQQAILGSPFRAAIKH